MKIQIITAAVNPALKAAKDRLKALKVKVKAAWAKRQTLARKKDDSPAAKKAFYTAHHAYVKIRDDELALAKKVAQLRKAKK